MKSKNNRNTSNIRGNWNNLRIIDKISEKITRKHDQTACNPTTAQSTTVTCHFRKCLLNVSVSTWASSRTSRTKEYNNGISVKKFIGGVKNIMFSIKTAKNI